MWDILTNCEPSLHTRAAGEVADDTSNKGQDSEGDHPPPDIGIDRDTIGQSLEHDEQTPFHRPQGQPEEDLHREELLEHHDQVNLQAGRGVHLPRLDGHKVVESRHRRHVQRTRDDEGDQRQVDEEVLSRHWNSVNLVPAGYASHEDGDDGDAETGYEHLLEGWLGCVAAMIHETGGTCGVGALGNVLGHGDELTLSCGSSEDRFRAPTLSGE